MHKKRLLAYVIDTIFITALVSLILILIPIDKKTSEIGTKMDDIGQQYATGSIDEITYFMNLSNYEKEMDENQALEIVINSIMIVIYFIIVPFITKGVTPGKKIMNLKIKNPNLMSLFIRAFIIDGLCANLCIIGAIYLISNKFYLTFVSIFLILQVLTLIINYFMIKYRHDCLGLDDILSKSRIE